MLRRVLENLLENAHKYSNVDQIIKLYVHVVSDAEERTIEIEISDEGIGIDAKDMPHIFTPCFRSDRSRARKTVGVGLGLPLARRIVRAHGGDIVLRSEVGVGTAAPHVTLIHARRGNADNRRRLHMMPSLKSCALPG